MTNPKLNGNLFQFGSKLVSIGSHKLPGADRFKEPSAMMTARRTIEDRIPMREVRDKSRRGRKVVGTRLFRERGFPSGDRVSFVSVTSEEKKIVERNLHEVRSDFENVYSNSREQTCQTIRKLFLHRVFHQSSRNTHSTTKIEKREREREKGKYIPIQSRPQKKFPIQRRTKYKSIFSIEVQTL